MLRIPYILVVGEREQEDGTVSVRSQSEGDQPQVMLIADFASLVDAQIEKEMAR